jgi:hypothetical protein
MTKKKLPSIARLRRKLDKVFSLYIRERDNYTCFTCGRKGKKHMQCGHALPKKMNGTFLRYHPLNAHCQCFVCNRYCEGNGLIYSINLRKRYGHDTDVKLVGLIDESKKFVATRGWYSDQIDYFENAIYLQQSVKELLNDTD